jgi:hypothetical protein
MKESVYRIKGIFLLITLFIYSSCEKDIILDLADTSGKYVIVDANIIDDGTTQWIRLTRSSSYYEVTTGEHVAGAKVEINDGESNFLFIESLVDSLKGFYFNSGISSRLARNNYTLHITTVDNNEYSAESELWPVPTLDSVSVKINPFSELGFGDEKIYDIIAHFEDLPKGGNHYLFNLYINRNLRTARTTEKAPVSDENLEDYVSLSVINLNAKDFSPGDTLTLEIRSISKEMFDFYNTFFFQTDLSGNPFAGAPPANIPTNLSEGARGFFQVSRVNRKSVIFQPAM